jgi:predicted CoA-binding protein
MTSRVADDEKTIRDLLTGTTTWAVVGLSANTFRPAYGVARFLQSVGKRIVPVHPRAETVHGEQGYRTLSDVPFDVDVVDVFVNSSRAGEIADEALLTKARGVWFQLGVIDEAAAQRVRDAGRAMVMDRCPAIEWPRLGLGR